jgi:hypothetical protein
MDSGRAGSGRPRERCGEFLSVNKAADISSNGKDNLGKAPWNPRLFACSVSSWRLLPVSAADAGFGDVDFRQ